MRHFPIFLDTSGKTILVSGAGECAVAKLRLLLKTQARIAVFDADPGELVRQWAVQGRVDLHLRDLAAPDLSDALLVYAANDDLARDLAVQALAKGAGVPALVVDNLEASDFITPAIVDRDPVTVAIGTEGTAPVLARAIKAAIEAKLPRDLGALARRAKALRPAADALPKGRVRRAFWTQFFFEGARDVDTFLTQVQSVENGPGRVHFVGAGPGDPDLLTLRARKLGFIFQAFNLLPRLTVTENVLLPVTYAREGPGDAQDRVVSTLDRVGLAHRAKHRPSQMSGGERQRVAIARALINRPRLILADEPTGNLDTQNVERILTLFKELNAEGQTIVLVTHDLDVAATAKRQIKMADGKIVSSGQSSD